ncbi:phage tail assembly protein [Oceanospirillum sediminis]|uniref:Phage tail assembly protein n=1 Tax=Oceanospirillum sediminis TaxID=2760088 RepID=A0A839IXQ2_9GAMM|nr:phage tail assembly protein [Oceanospirillum sediminis]MBB1489374.1 phage tail assembly protein [Oceanospirillum sediminis]
MEPIWQDLNITLYVPLQRDNGEKHDTLTLKMITRNQHQTLLKEHEGDNWSFYRALIKLGAELSDQELNNLTGPDFNSLCEQADLAYGMGSDYWFEKLIWADLPKSEQKKQERKYHTPDSLPLLIPVQTIKHGETDYLPLTLPTVGAINAMYSVPEDQQEAFIIQSVTGLMEDELDNLSVPDGKSLYLRVADFLSKTGDHFSALTTSKP